MLDCFLIILESCPASLNSITDLGSFLVELGKTVEDNKASAEKGSSYVKFIETVFHHLYLMHLSLLDMLLRRYLDFSTSALRFANVLPCSTDM